MKFIKLLVSILLFVNIANATQRILAADIIEGQNTAKNYLGNRGHFEKNVLGVLAYADAAAAVPVDGTGGSPTLTCTRTTSSPISGDGSLLITKDAANRQGNGCSIDFTIDSGDKAKVLQIEFDYLVGSGTFVAGTSTADSDLIVDIYDVTNSVLIEPSTKKLFSNSTTLTDRYVSNFQTSSSSTSYRLIIHAASTSASAYTVKVDNIKVALSKYIYGTPITDWLSYTPTYTGLGTVSGSSAFYRRIGDSLEVKGKVIAGTSTGVAIKISLPNGRTIDTTKLAATKTNTLGVVTNATAGSRTLAGTGGGPFIIMEDTGTDATVVFIGNTINASGVHYVAGLGNAMTSSGDSLSFAFSVPILGLSSSIQMSDSADTRIVAARAFLSADQTGVNTNGSAVKVNIDSTSSTGGGFDTHGAWASNKYTAPSAGIYEICANVSTLSTNMLASYYQITFYKNGSQFSWGPVHVLAATAQVLQEHYCDHVNMVAGDYLEVYFYGTGNNSSSTITLDGDTSGKFTFVTVKKLSGPSAIAATESISVEAPGAATTIASSWTQINLGTPTADTHGMLASSNITVPAPGWYDICDITGTNATSSFAVNQRFSAGYSINNASVQRAFGGEYRASTTGTVQPKAGGCALRKLSAGDIVRFFAINDPGNVALSTADTNVSVSRRGL